jgi:DNA-binding transcriptional LysR family regulator
MTLTQLSYFCAVCRTHSITRAAETLFVSQPTISTALRDLEKEFHCRLFIHGKNRISLTDEGADFYDEALRILKETERLKNRFDRRESERPLRIGIPPILSTVCIPELTDRFEEETGVPVQLFEYGSIRAGELVEKEDLDVALGNLDMVNLDTYNYFRIMEDSYVFCLSKGHSLVRSGAVNLESLSKLPLLLFNTDSMSTETVISYFQSRNMEIRVKMYCSQLMTLLRVLESGQCGAVLYRSIPVDETGFVKIPLPGITCKVGILWKKGVFVQENLQKFIDFVKKSTSKGKKSLSME